jgi:hypothetical protein
MKLASKPQARAHLHTAGRSSLVSRLQRIIAMQQVDLELADAVLGHCAGDRQVLHGGRGADRVDEAGVFLERRD